MNHRKPRAMFFIGCLLILCTLARAQMGAVANQGSGSVLVDATRFSGVIAMDAPWRFQPRDDPRFAALNFDDSAWPLMQPGVDRLLAASHIANEPDGNGWARLHLHLAGGDGQLAVTLTVRGETQYAVFANGKQIGMTKGFLNRRSYYSQPLALNLPQAQDIVLAIHFIAPGRPVIHYFPLEGAEIGQSEAVRNKLDLRRYAQFEDGSLGYMAMGAVYLAAAPFSLALWLGQRKHSEYLWLALVCVFSGMSYWLAGPVVTGQAPLWVFQVAGVVDALEGIATVEFVAVLAKFRRRRFVRVVQAITLLPLALVTPALARFSSLSYTVNSVLMLAVITYALIVTYKRKREDTGLLLFPLILLPISSLTLQAQSAYPDRFGQMWTGHLGGVGFNAFAVASTSFITWLMAVVLYRFIRVSKEEQTAAAEMEAAKTVQQLLISTVPPAVSRFSVESVYLPAQQVGGDFFLVLPAPAGSEDESLLIVIGDVSGKGLQAAMVVATIMGGLHMQLSRAPAQLLSYLNRMLTGHISGFVTCCAVLVHQDGRMQIANAGNPSPYCDGEEMETLPGLPLGLDQGVLYEETDHVLSVGSRLAFVSDGVIEATSSPRRELFGFDRIKAISTQPAHAIALAASQFGVGGPQADDITVLTVVYAGM